MEFPRRIALAETRELLLRSLPIVFVDARKERDWRSSDLQLPDAIRVPPDDIDAHLGSVPRDQGTIVVYCTCPHEESSAAVAQRLIEHGYGHVYVLDGGFRRWLESDGDMQRRDEKRRSHQQTQPNLVADKEEKTESFMGKGPSGESRKGRD